MLVQKTGIHLCILSVILGKSQMGVWALFHALQLQSDFFFQNCKGGIVSRHNWKKNEKKWKKIVKKTWFYILGRNLFRRALKWITVNKKKNILIHYQDNELMYVSTKNWNSSTYFECDIGKVPNGGLGAISRPSTPIWFFFQNCKGGIVSRHNWKKNEKKWKILSRKLDFTFWGATFLEGR